MDFMNSRLRGTDGGTESARTTVAQTGVCNDLLRPLAAQEYKPEDKKFA